MKNQSNKEFLIQSKSPHHHLHNPINQKNQSLDKKHTFVEITNYLKDYLKKILLNELHLEKTFQIIEKLKDKYEKDIYTIFQTNLKIKGCQINLNKNLDKDKEQQKNLDKKGKIESVQFLPLESFLKISQQEYKLTLNGGSVKDLHSKKLNINTKKTIDTEASLNQEVEDLDKERGRNIYQTKSPLTKNKAKSQSPQRQQNLSKAANGKKLTNNIRGMDYIYKQMHKS